MEDSDGGGGEGERPGPHQHVVWTSASPPAAVNLNEKAQGISSRDTCSRCPQHPQSRGSRRCWPAGQSVSSWGTSSPGLQHPPALSMRGFQEQVLQFLTCDYEDPGAGSSTCFERIAIILESRDKWLCHLGSSASRPQEGTEERVASFIHPSIHPSIRSVSTEVFCPQGLCTYCSPWLEHLSLQGSTRRTLFSFWSQFKYCPSFLGGGLLLLLLLFVFGHALRHLRS